MPAECYSCRFRAAVPGDAHSECRHPAATLIRSLTAMAKAYDSPPDLAEVEIDFPEDPPTPAIALTLVAHGVRNNWATWPLAYDPIWVKRCTGHTLPERVHDGS